MAGGDQVVDIFTVNSLDVVEKLAGEFNLQGSGALVVSNRTSVLVSDSSRYMLPLLLA